jgi:hypothetical protein
MFAYVSEKINESYRRGDDVESPKEDNFMSMKKDKKES